MSTNNNSNNVIPIPQGTVAAPNPNYATYTFTGGGWNIIYPTVPIPAEPVEEKKPSKDGCNCKKCKEFYPYAEPNQEDGSLICFACRHGY